MRRLHLVCCLIWPPLLAGCVGSGVEQALPCAAPPLIELATPSAPPGAIIYPDETLPGVEGVVIDATPWRRGEHAVDRWWRDPASCELVGGTYSWGPPQPAEGAAPDAWATTGPGGSTISLLLLTNADPGADDDADRWAAVAEAMGARAEHLHEPPNPQAIEAALEAMCLGAHAGTSAVLVAAGRATPAAGGAFYIAGEAVSWAWLRDALLAACDPAGLLVHVSDASWTASDLWAPPLKRDGALMVWAASDDAAPDAWRLAPGGGGLLTAGLSERVVARAGQACLPPGLLTPTEVAWAFGDHDGVSALMLQLGAGLGPAGVAEAPRLTTLGASPPIVACIDDLDCAARAAVCPLTPCGTLRCEDGVCVPAPDVGGLCQDGSACTVDDRCDAAGLCAGEVLDCEDGNPCTENACLWHSGCVSAPVAEGMACDDTDSCTLEDACDGAGVCAGVAVDCDDKNPCTSDTCHDGAGCIYGDAKASCDDGNPCTHQDFCSGGYCTGLPTPCKDDSPCTVDACDPDIGCRYIGLPAGTPCDDQDPCTTGDLCDVDGGCAGPLVVCDDGIECTVDACGEAGCEHLPVPGTCATPSGDCVKVGDHLPDNPCLQCVATDQVVADESAIGAPCLDDGVACTDDVCDATGACVHLDQPGTCHTADGTCVGLGEALAECLVCGATGTGVPAPPGAPCDDQTECTDDDVCTSLGLCAGEPVPCCSAAPVSTCGVTLDGDTSAHENLVADWQCVLGVDYPSPEGTHLFVSPCTGPVTFALEAPPGMLMFISRETPDGTPAQQACQAGQCDTYTASNLTLVTDEGEELVLVVDGNFGVAAPYAITIECDCAGLTP